MPVRGPLATVLGVLGCLLCVLSLVALWARDQVLDTDRYVASVAPLAADPAVQDEVSHKVARAITARLDLPSPLRPTATRLVGRTTDALVRSPAFPELWRDLNRTTHPQLVAALRDERTTSDRRDGRLRLDLTPVVDAARKRLADAGLAVVTRIPSITLTVDVADTRGWDRARQAVSLIDRYGRVLPLATLAAWLAALVVARRRLRAAVLMALGTLAAAGLLLLARSSGSALAAARVPRSTASAAAVEDYYAHVTTLLRDGALTVAAGAALVVVVLLVLGALGGAVRSRA